MTVIDLFCGVGGYREGGDGVMNIPKKPPTTIEESVNGIIPNKKDGLSVKVESGHRTRAVFDKRSTQNAPLKKVDETSEVSALNVAEKDAHEIEPKTMEEILKSGQKYAENKIVTKRLLFLPKLLKIVTILRGRVGGEKRSQV